MTNGKKTAHLTLAVFDIIAVFGVYWATSSYNSINTALENSIGIISFNDRFFSDVGFLIVPIAHTLAIIEATTKSFYERYIRKIVVYIYIGLVVIFLAIPFIMTNHVKARLESATYQYCHVASKHRKLTSDLVYVKDIKLCTEDLKKYKPVF